MAAAAGVHVVRVRYAETDQMGVAHHAAYVPWLEEARIAWLRAVGSSYREVEAAGVLMPVIALSVRYLAPVRFDDEVVITTTARILGPSRMVFASSLACADAARAEAEVTVAATSRAGRPVRLPAGLAAILGPSAD